MNIRSVVEPSPGIRPRTPRAGWVESQTLIVAQGPFCGGRERPDAPEAASAAARTAANAARTASEALIVGLRLDGMSDGVHECTKSCANRRSRAHPHCPLRLGRY